eukprot:scaffold111564_cov75-Phaeocystis_antarctica.AAC.1
MCERRSTACETASIHRSIERLLITAKHSGTSPPTTTPRTKVSCEFHGEQPLRPLCSSARISDHSAKDTASCRMRGAIPRMNQRSPRARRTPQQASSKARTRLVTAGDQHIGPGTRTPHAGGGRQSATV